MNNNNHGGKRVGAGRKPNPEKSQILFRNIPISIYDSIAEYVDKAVEAHKAKSFLK